LLGTPFLLQCGIWQGGVLSPFLFAIYLNDLIDKLRQSGFGLYVGSLFVGCILYADDIALLSCSCYGLQKLIDICYDYGVKWDIKFNPQKSQAATFGGNSPPVSVKVGDAALGWVSNVKYLGCYRGRKRK